MLEVTDLTISGPDGALVLDSVSFRLDEGERLGVLGESGAGKSTLALAVLGALRPGLTHRGGTVRLGGHDMLTAPPPVVRKVRRQLCSWVPQDPRSALTRHLRVERQIRELAPPGSPDETDALLSAVGLPGGPAMRRRHTWQLSGGQQQRVALARALANRPKLVVLDEPTTGLDVFTRDRILQLLDELAADRGFAVLHITHDIPAAARSTDKLIVLSRGQVAARGDTVELLRDPSEKVLSRIVAATPDPTTALAKSTRGERPQAEVGTPVLSLRRISLAHGRNRIAADLDLDLFAGETLGLLGESGSGKSTIAHAMVGFHRPASGEIRLDAVPLPRSVLGRTRAHKQAIQIIPQDGAGSLSPRHTLLEQVAWPIRILRQTPPQQANEQAAELLASVGLPPALHSRLPSALSGGQRQRAALARALGVRPKVLICDEITSNLDPETQAEVMDVVRRLAAASTMAILLVSHDLGILAEHCDRIAVLYQGAIVEQGATSAVIGSPQHEWTKALIDKAPSLTRELDRRVAAAAA